MGRYNIAFCHLMANFDDLGSNIVSILSQLKFSNSEQAVTITIVPPEKKDGTVADNNGDAKNIPDDKNHKKDYRRKFKKPKNSASKGGIEKDGNATPSSTVRPKQKRKFPSRDEISQAR